MFIQARFGVLHVFQHRLYFLQPPLQRGRLLFPEHLVGHSHYTPFHGLRPQRSASRSDPVSRMGRAKPVFCGSASDRNFPFHSKEVLALLPKNHDLKSESPGLIARRPEQERKERPGARHGGLELPGRLSILLPRRIQGGELVTFAGVPRRPRQDVRLTGLSVPPADSLALSDIVV